jgi:hypothetical protein
VTNAFTAGLSSRYGLREVRLGPSESWGAGLGACACALALAACGGSGGGGGGSAKQGACVGASSAGAAHVVDCGSSGVKATLVDNGEVPSKAIACVTIDAGTENDFSVTVAGKVYCARPKGSGGASASGTSTATETTTAAATTAGGAEAVPPAFVAALNRIEGPYRKWAADVVAELRRAGSQSDATLESMVQALARRAAALAQRLEGLQPAPAPVSPPFLQLIEGTNKSFTALERLAGAGAVHSAALARRSARDLERALARAGNGIDGLKRAGIK